MKTTDLAYVAGIVDGEGCIMLYLNKSKKYTSYRIKVSVSNTQEWICQWLKLAFGGCVSCEYYKSPTRKPLWQWIVVSNKALDFLKLIHPYLRLKKPQAEIAIKFQEARRGHHATEGERAIAEAEMIIMHSLNKRGRLTTEPLISRQNA